jgi:hypothetical protein
MSHDSVRLFISYSHVDEDWQRKIADELELLDISVWVDGQIKPGDRWQLEIERELEAADIILLLISRDFLRSDFVRNEELPKALARLQDHDQPARVVPVLLRETTWKRKFDIAGLQAIPSGERWLKGWDDEDAAIRSVAKELEVIVEDVERLREQRKDNEENYRKAVAEALADDDEISVWEQRTLETERQRLAIPPAVAEEIVAAERRRVEVKLENIREYEEDIAIAIRRVGRPFDDKTREELKVRKSKLELRDDDVVGLEDRVAMRLEAELAERSDEEAQETRDEEPPARRDTGQPAPDETGPPSSSSSPPPPPAVAERQALDGTGPDRHHHHHHRRHPPWPSARPWTGPDRHHHHHHHRRHPPWPSARPWAGPTSWRPRATPWYRRSSGTPASPMSISWARSRRRSSGTLAPSAGSPRTSASPG